MKVVFSRKGFDQSFGGMASPILPDGRLIPLPIPSSHDIDTMADLNVEGVDLHNLLQDLSKGKHGSGSTIHLDPDLNRPRRIQPDGWLPALGQTGAAQAHLAGCGIGVGDVFLFFGWFRQVEHHAGRWRFVPGAQNKHVMFGWLEIEQVMPIVTDRVGSLKTAPWIQNHAHVRAPDHYNDPRNTLYVAARKSKFTQSHGGGCFSRVSDRLYLSHPGVRLRSVWRLPQWAFPDRRPPLTYHGDLSRWSMEDGHAVLRSVGKGQEFVIDSAHYPELEPWVASLVGEHA